MVHITDQVEQIVRRKRRTGRPVLRLAHAHHRRHYVNDLESGLIEDIGKWLEELASERPGYKHHQTGEDNGDAHLKSLLLHHETTLPVPTAVSISAHAARLLRGIRRPAQKARDCESAWRE